MLSGFAERKLKSRNDTTSELWNTLPNAVVDVDSVDLYKSKLGNFWMFQDVKYNYTVNLAGTGDRTKYDTKSY